MKFKILLTISCLIFVVGNVFSQSTPKFLIISLDGIYPQAWDVAHTPNIDLLIPMQVLHWHQAIILPHGRLYLLVYGRPNTWLISRRLLKMIMLLIPISLTI